MESSNVDKETVIIIKKNIYFSYLLKNSEKKKTYSGNTEFSKILEFSLVLWNM